MKKTLLLAVAITGIFTLTARAQADYALLTPKAKELRDSLRTVPGTTTDMIDRSIQPGTPKSRELAYSLRKVPSTGPTIDLAHATRPTMSPKDPRYEIAFRENAVREFQIAPMK